MRMGYEEISFFQNQWLIKHLTGCTCVYLIDRQHIKDYGLTDHEIYADILAYTPVVANSKDWQIEVKREQRVIDYINKAVKKSKKPESAKKQREALCRAFANAVTTNTKKSKLLIIFSIKADFYSL